MLRRRRRAPPDRVSDFKPGGPSGPHGAHQHGAQRVAEPFAAKPQATLPFEEEARKVMTGNQVAQSIRAEQRVGDDPSMAALEANAAGQQPVGRQPLVANNMWG